MRNIKLTLEYDGTDFVGSQLQAAGRTVQGELENALAKLCNLPAEERFRVNLAGRTDTGVHAAGQVASFRTESQLPVETFRRGANALLPYDVAVLLAEEVEETFHARFSATERHYTYTVINRRPRLVLEQRFASHVAEPLDIEAMNLAAQYLIGEHDFAAFAGNGWGVHPEGDGDKPGTIRRLIAANWRTEVSNLPAERGITLKFDVAANAFLPHMVRNIVGTLLLIGKGAWQPTTMATILAGRDRRRAGPTAPACGLSLVKVLY